MSRDDRHQHGPDCDHPGVSSKVHRDPPTSPPHLIDDGYLVEPRHLDPRVPWHGWDHARDRWQRASDRPISQRAALAGCLASVALVLAVLALLIAAPRPASTIHPPASRSGQTTEPVDVSRPSSAALSGASVPSPSSRDPEAAGAAASPETAQPSPGPTGGIGTALVGGWATYYATCSECAAAGPLLQAALGPDWQGSWVTVESDHGKVLLRLVTSCACGDRRGQPTIIDVSIPAFNELSAIPAGADTDPGLVAVSIELPGPRPTLPATDIRMMLEARDDEAYR